jgi:hypothetical protein
MNMFRLTVRTAIAQAAASVLLLGAPEAFATEGTAPVLCEPYQVKTELVAVRRTSPGEISVDVAYQHESNFPYKLNAAGGVALIDSNGEKWESADKGNNLSKMGDMTAGIKYKHSYKFFKRVGGGDVTAVNFTNHFRVWQGSKLLGACNFEAKGVALN